EPTQEIKTKRTDGPRIAAKRRGVHRRFPTRHESVDNSPGVHRSIPATPAKINTKATTGRAHSARFKARSGAGMSTSRTPGPVDGGTKSSPISAQATNDMRIVNPSRPQKRLRKGFGISPATVWT